jgi:carbamoyltransferase
MDLAASIQQVTEEIFIKIARHAKKITGSNNLCLSGGVALNCVANGKLLKENIFEISGYSRPRVMPVGL